MPDGSEELTLQTFDRISAIDSMEWDRCAGDDNPFVSYAFLSALEDSGSVSAESGWLPQHLTLRDAAGRLLGAMPLYVKGHSHGEYVFDYAIADAYERAGGRYYPKLLSAVPFTPVPGPRFLVHPDEDRRLIVKGLVSGLVQVADRYGISSVHINFLPGEDVPLLQELGFLIRHGHQYHWENHDYQSFDDFLGALSSRKRKSIRKERAKLQDSSIELTALSGDDITPNDWDYFYRFYIDTYDRKWGAPYLRRPFFDLLQERLADNVVLVMAYLDDLPIAGALNLKGKHRLYGRNWGCDGDYYKFLHFEACYYQAIDYAIEQGLDWVEAGTQGEHKIQRGYLPVRTYSAHWFPDAGFSDAVDRYFDQEKAEERHLMAHLMEMSPYKVEN